MKEIFDYLDKVVKKHKKAEFHIDIRTNYDSKLTHDEKMDMYENLKACLDYIVKETTYGTNSDARESWKNVEGKYRGIRMEIYSAQWDNPNYVEKEKIEIPDGKLRKVDVFFKLIGIKTKSKDALQKRLRNMMTNLMDKFKVDCGTYGIDDGFRVSAEKNIMHLSKGKLLIEYDKDRGKIIIKDVDDKE